MDSDGYISKQPNKTGFSQFCQSESVLKDDVIRLLKSMGLEVKVEAITAEEQNRRKVTSVNNGALDIISRKTTYKIGFSAFDCPFRLPRKTERWAVPKFKESHLIKNITEVDKVLMRCLTVDSIDKLYACGNNWTLTHNTATGARSALDATATRRMNLVRNISENLVKPLIRKWMAYNAEFLEEEEVVRVTNAEYVPVRRDDLEGRIDLDITISTAEDNAAKSQELSFLLQTLGPNEDPAIRREIMADIMDLMRMPDQAKRMREYQPQTDPKKEQAEKLELERMALENENLKATIQDRLARANENVIDARLKENKAAAEAAKARKLESEADMTDLKFLKSDEGFDHMEKIDLEDRKHKQRLIEKLTEARANMEQLQYQQRFGDKQLGVLR